MTHTIEHRPKPELLTGHVSLQPGVPRALASGGEISGFVDRDAETGERTYRFELTIHGITVSAFGLHAGFASQAIAYGWAITHYATSFDDAGAVSLLHVALH